MRNGRNRGKKPGFYDICLLVAFDGLKKPGFWGCLTSANKKPGFYFSVGWVAKVVARNPVSGVGVGGKGCRKKPGFWGWVAKVKQRNPVSEKKFARWIDRD